MYTIYIVMIISIVTCFILWHDDYMPWFFIIFEAIGSIIVGGAIGFLIGTIISLILPMDTYTKIYSYNIGKIPNTTKYLGYTNISEDNYVVMVNNNMVFIPKKRITIVTDSCISPIVYIKVKKETISMINKFAVDGDVNDKFYTVVIPKNDVYDLEAEIQ